MKKVIWAILFFNTLVTFGQTKFSSDVAGYSIEFPGNFGERKLEESAEILYEDKENGLLYFSTYSRTDKRRVKKKELETYAKSRLKVGSPAIRIDTFDLVKLGGKNRGRGSFKSVNQRYSTYYKFDFVVYKNYEIIVGIISQKDNINWADLDAFSSSFRFNH